MARVSILALFALFAACAADSDLSDAGADGGAEDASSTDGGPREDAGVPPPIGLASGYVFSAFAAETVTSTSGPLNVSCQLEFVLELRDEVSRTVDRVEYSGTLGGETFRSLLLDDGSGFAFRADAFGELVATIDRPDRVVFRVPINETADGRFWREQARIEGTLREDGSIDGEWTCAPLDIDQGYVDTEHSVTGTWFATPIVIEPEPEPEEIECETTAAATVTSTGAALEVGGARATIPAGALPDGSRVTFCRLNQLPPLSQPIAHTITSSVYVLDLGDVEPQADVELVLPRLEDAGGHVLAAVVVGDAWQPYEACEVTDEAVTSYVRASGTFTILQDTVVFGDSPGGAGSAQLTFGGADHTLIVDGAGFPPSYAIYALGFESRTIDVRMTSTTAAGFHELRLSFELDGSEMLAGEAVATFRAFLDGTLESWDYVPGIHEPGAFALSIDTVDANHLEGTFTGHLFGATSSTAISGGFTADVEEWRWPPELYCPGREG